MPNREEVASPWILFHPRGGTVPKSQFCLLELHNHFHRAKISPVEYQLHTFLLTPRLR